MRQNLGYFGKVAARSYECAYAYPRLSVPVSLKCAGERAAFGGHTEGEARAANRSQEGAHVSGLDRRFGPGCCRLVSSLGLALLGEDNRPASAGPASAEVSGCVRRLSDACKSSLLTRGTPRPFAPVGTRDVRRETRPIRHSFAEDSSREKENTAVKVKPFREGGSCRVERVAPRLPHQCGCFSLASHRRTAGNSPTHSPIRQFTNSPISSNVSRLASRMGTDPVSPNVYKGLSGV